MNSIGKDLATIRKHLNQDLENLHHKTRIPLETLKRIEDDSLLSDPNENIIYVRSFIRTYTKALKIDQELVVKALDQSEVGNYNGLLLETYPELQPVKPASPDSGNEKSKIKSTEKPTEDTSEASDLKPAPLITGTESNSSDFRVTPATKVVKDDKWARIGHQITSGNNTIPVWLIGVIVIVAIILIALFIILDSDSFGSNDVSQFESGEAEGPELRLDFSPQEPDPEPVPAATLPDTLYITLYAAYDRMEPVRVYSDLKARIDPYWIEQGIAMNFEFRDTIRISGQYDRMLLFLNGHRVDNFRQNYFNPDENAVELTRDTFSDSQENWASVIPLDLPEDTNEPDSVIARPSF